MSHAKNEKMLRFRGRDITRFSKSKSPPTGGRIRRCSCKLLCDALHRALPSPRDFAAREQILAERDSISVALGDPYLIVGNEIAHHLDVEPQQSLA